MSEHELRTDAHIVESDPEIRDALYKPCGFPASNGWARLAIPMSGLTDEQRRAVYDADALLRSAGVCFDTGSGFGARDWELDWSLTCAIVKVKEIYCSECKRKGIWGWLPVVVWESGAVYVFCSNECRAKTIESRSQPRQEQMTSESLETVETPAWKVLAMLNHWYAEVRNVNPPEEPKHE